MAGKGGARPGAGRKKKHIKIADVIKDHCHNFIVEMMKDKEIYNRANREVQTLIEFEEDCKINEDYIYLIKSNGLYKIGYTTNLKSRLNDYKVHFGLVELIYVYKGFNCYELETILHNLVMDKNHRGEWFELNNNDVISIVSYCSKLIN
jgi:hypothetical protein